MLTVLQGDCRDVLKTLPDESVHCCVTSPPYFGLRDYGVDGQIGLESSLDEYVANLVGVFREVRRVLRSDGTLWLNLGDSYAANRGYQVTDNKHVDVGNTKGSTVPDGLKPKDLCGVPWRVAFALQADGWWLRSDIIWSKPNPMPESVTDRPTKAHEYVFLLSRAQTYYYDAAAIQERSITGDMRKPFAPGQVDSRGNGHDRGGGTVRKSDTFRRENSKRAAVIPGQSVGTHRPDRSDTLPSETRNARSVWEIATRPYADAHFATFPEALVEPCILAGCRTGGTVLDPFAGSGTVGRVALSKGRQAILIELNPEYCKLIDRRCETTYGLPFSLGS